MSLAPPLAPPARPTVTAHVGGRWMRRALTAAGVYNLLWGAAVVLLPRQTLALLGLADANYPQLWQCIGMIVGVYGIGYLCAATDPLRHWPITLVGLLGKVFGPVGFVVAIVQGHLPLQMGWTILTNDLIWWVPFALILWHAARAAQAPRTDDASPAMSLEDALAHARSQDGDSLAELSDRQPVLLTFLRHAGCTFCREALADLKQHRGRFPQDEAKLAFVHMGPEDAETQRFFETFGFADAPRFSDPGCRLYRTFELRRGSFAQLFSPKVWWRGLRACLFRGHGVGRLAGDGFQMPGVFLVHQRRIVHAYRHRTAADRPDYAQLAGCSLGSSPDTPT